MFEVSLSFFHDGIFKDTFGTLNMKIILRIVIFITGNRKYYNGITITIHKFGCYI